MSQKWRREINYCLRDSKIKLWLLMVAVYVWNLVSRVCWILWHTLQQQIVVKLSKFIAINYAAESPLKGLQPKEPRNRAKNNAHKKQQQQWKENTHDTKTVNSDNNKDSDTLSHKQNGGSKKTTACNTNNQQPTANNFDNDFSLEFKNDTAFAVVVAVIVVVESLIQSTRFSQHLCCGHNRAYAQ